MAIEKMMLVRASGSTDRLHLFVLKMLSAEWYHPENAEDIYTSAQGYRSCTKPCPFEQSIRDIENISSLAGGDLSQNNLCNVIGTDRKLTDEYIETLTKYINSNVFKSSDINMYLSDIKPQIDSYAQMQKYLDESEKILKQKMSDLSHFSDLDAPLEDILGTDYIEVHFGSIPKDSMVKLDMLDNDNSILFNTYSSDEKNCWGLYCTPKKYAKEAEKIFSSLYFEELHIDNDRGTIKSVMENCQESLDAIEKEKEKIHQFWVDNSEQLIKDYSILIDLQNMWSFRRYEVKKDGSFFAVGWIPKKNSDEFKKLLDSVETVEYTIEEPEKKPSAHNKLTPPTKLKNPKIFSPYEYYVEMYGVPTYGSIDITTFVSITYTVLFGIMFGDLGQGFILMIAGLLMWKLKKIALGKILVPCGISSMCFGVVFGSVFGYEEMLDPLYKAVGLPGKPISVMDSINSILLYAISIGIALVAVAILINIYANLKAKQFGAAIFDNNGLAGLSLYLCAVSLAVEFMAHKEFIPKKICVPVIAVCAVLLFFKEILIGIIDKHDNWKPESVFDFIMQNFFELIEYVLSYFSNTVSFLRVGAFVLVHAGMMMVVFSLAGASKNIVVIILGNILIICLEGLLTGIQALRLEFYEMFSRCFDGSGKPFVSTKQILAGQQINK